MQLRFIKVILVYGMLLFLPILQGSGHVASVVYAAKARHVKDADWNEVLADKELNYKNQREQPVKKPDTDTGSNWLKRLISAIFSNTGKMIFLTVVIIVFFYGVYRFVIIDKTHLFKRKPKKVAQQEEVIDEEENFLNTDWKHHLQQARDAHDFPLAIRYTYTLLLQKMVLRGLVHYTPDKTNHEYVKELKDETLKAAFKTLTRQYEFAWYGHYPVTENEYNDFAHRFESINVRLR